MGIGETHSSPSSSSQRDYVLEAGGVNIVRIITPFYSVFSVRLAHPRRHITASRPGGSSISSLLLPLAQGRASAKVYRLVSFASDGCPEGS